MSAVSAALPVTQNPSNQSDLVRAQPICNPDGTNVASSATGSNYETVAAAQTAQVLGGAGAIGDLLNGILVVPATTSPGAVTILDGATSIVVFVGGASSVTSLIPFFVYLGIKSVSGPWKITTGASVSVIGVGTFT